MTEVSDELLEIQAKYCATFSSAVRLRIMLILHEGEVSVGEIASQVGIAIQAISQHLRLMKDRNVVSSRKQGREVFYRITNDKFVLACDLIREALIEEAKKKNRIMFPRGERSHE